MTPNELMFSFIVWLCIGFLLGYRYHVRQVRQATLAKTGRDVDHLLADVAIACVERPTDVRTN